MTLMQAIAKAEAKRREREIAKRNLRAYKCAYCGNNHPGITHTWRGQ